jgi:hypothetical protein
MQTCIDSMPVLAPIFLHAQHRCLQWPQSAIASGPADYIRSVPVLTVIFTLMPWSMLAKGALDLGSASLDDSSNGLKWSQRSRCGRGLRCAC